MYNIDKTDGLMPLTVSQMEEIDGGGFKERYELLTLRYPTCIPVPTIQF